MNRWLSVLVLLAAGWSQADQGNYSSWVDPAYPTQLLWGDTHIHTRLSADAFSMGDSLTPEDAYRFARGETVRGLDGQPVRLSRPLDFAMVSDHAEYIGVSALLTDDPARLEGSELGQRWRTLAAERQFRQILFDNRDAGMGQFNMAHDEALNQSVWQQIARTADRFNAPGSFTTFIGYEWTSLPGGNNLHRNVLYRDSADAALALAPFTAMDSRDPEDLWQYLDRYERSTGGRVLAIPHNPNISNGLMFADVRFDGSPITAQYASARSRWEPVVEVTQIKGDSETHPLLSPDDAFADFETWDAGNFAPTPDPKEPWMLSREYARAALRSGLAIEQQVGENPYRFGMIGSSDTHTGLSAIEENSFFGKFSIDAPSAERLTNRSGALARYAAAGFVGVWAAENTREAIFDAFERREVYATTGTRIRLRVYAGWDFENTDAARADAVQHGARHGVPMGGLLSPGPAQTLPSLLIVAAKDAFGANLERVQVVKGWVDASGSTHERVYDVALSDGRTPGSAVASAPDMSVTVDAAMKTVGEPAGAAELAVVWRDEQHDPTVSAFWYVRVLEMPTPRWSTYDAAFFAVKPAEGYPTLIQERAYSSPIWYRP